MSYQPARNTPDSKIPKILLAGVTLGGVGESILVLVCLLWFDGSLMRRGLSEEMSISELKSLF